MPEDASPTTTARATHLPHNLSDIPLSALSPLRLINPRETIDLTARAGD